MKTEKPDSTKEQDKLRTMLLRVSCLAATVNVTAEIVDLDMRLIFATDILGGLTGFAYAASVYRFPLDDESPRSRWVHFGVTLFYGFSQFFDAFAHHLFW